ncbi:hypothetical protein [Methylobacterium sp. A54F]
MRRAALALLLSVLALPALGQPRTASPRMTCQEAMDLVRREGSVTLSLGRAPPERFVRDRSFCELTEIAELRFVPTRDNPECPIGYRCKEPAFEDWDWQ